MGREDFELYRHKIAPIGFLIRIVSGDIPRYRDTVHFPVWLVGFSPWDLETLYLETIIPPPTVYRAVEVIIDFSLAGLFSFHEMSGCNRDKIYPYSSERQSCH
jgi:hypothetical protein